MDHVITRPQVLQCTLLRSRPTSFRNCIAKPLSQKRYVRKFLFVPPSSRNIRRPYEDLGTNGISCRRFSSSLTTSQVLHHFSCERVNVYSTQRFRREECCLQQYRRRVVLWGAHKVRGEKVNGIHV